MDEYDERNFLQQRRDRRLPVILPSDLREISEFAGGDLRVLGDLLLADDPVARLRELRAARGGGQ